MSWPSSASADRQNASTDCWYGLCLGGVEPAVHGAVVPDAGREAPQVDGDEEVADGVGVPSRPHPVAEDLVEEAVAATPGAVEHEAAHAVGVRQRELLRDRASHRRSDHVWLLEAERVHERDRVPREVGDRVRPLGRRRPADATVVERREPVAVAQARDLVDPAGTLVGQPGDEEHVGPLALLLDP